MKREKKATGRINVYLSDRGWQRLNELGQLWYPGRQRVDGMVVERAIDEAWERAQPTWGDPYRPRHVTHNGEHGVPPAIPPFTTELDPEDGEPAE